MSHVDLSLLHFNWEAFAIMGAITTLVLHGWQSLPGGVKPSNLKVQSHPILNPKYPNDDMDEAFRISQAEFDQQQPQVVVGSY